MTLMHNDTEFAPASGFICPQGLCEHGAPHECSCDMWADEKEHPLMIGLYVAVIVVVIAGSALWPYWITP